MSPTRLTTALFGCALALVFFFGNIAPGLAYEETFPGSSIASIRLDFSTGHRLSRSGAPVFDVVSIGETCDAVTPTPKAQEIPRMFETPPETRAVRPPVFASFHGQKVSRHLLDSILLI
jgi:hypothetical protein